MQLRRHLTEQTNAELDKRSIWKNFWRSSPHRFQHLIFDATIRATFRSAMRKLFGGDQESDDSLIFVLSYIPVLLATGRSYRMSRL